MKSRKMSLAAAAWLAASLATGAVHAAELTLYQHQSFGGNQLTLRGHSPNIGNYGFDDKASSIIVNSGRWQVCAQADFKGHCAELVPGEYPSLDHEFNDRISSAREVGTYGKRTGSYRYYGRGIIKFFDEPGFRGRALDMQRDTGNLTEQNYNDRAASIIVSEGVWELCSDANYSGNCRRYSPGRYADLGPGMANLVSSAHLVRNTGDAPARMGGGWGGTPRNTEGTSRMILFADEGLRGPSMAVSDTMTNLQAARFNDAAASLIVEGGSWLVCSDAGFGGNCRVFAPGRYEHLRDVGLSRAISSARPTSPEPVGRRWGGSEGVQLFTQRDFGGESRTFGSDVPNLRGGGFNDRAVSMVVNGGEWELCSEAGYAGNCMVVGPGAYGNLGGLSAQLSSMRRLR